MAKKTNKQIERDELIYQLTTLVAGEFSLQEVLDKLAEAAVKIVNVKACSIRLLDEESGDLKMRSTYGLSEQYRNKGEVSREDPVIKAAFAGEAMVLDDMRLDDRVKYKEAAIRGFGQPLKEGLRIEAECFNRLLDTPEILEGARQFVERDHPDRKRNGKSITPGL